MPTRSHIIVREKEDEPINERKYIYHHFDGYPEGVGQWIEVRLRQALETKAQAFVTKEWITETILSMDDDYEPDEGLHGDEEYFYVLTPFDNKKGLNLSCYKTVDFKINKASLCFSYDDGFCYLYGVALETPDSAKKPAKPDAVGPIRYTSTDKGKRILFGHKDVKLSFLKKHYVVDETAGEITCILDCRINIEQLFRHFGLSKYALNLITEGLLKTHDEMVFATKSINTISKKGVDRYIIPEPAKKKTCDGKFVVQATVKTDEGDFFDEQQGKLISEAKAKHKAYLKVDSVYTRLAKLFHQVSESFRAYAAEMYRHSIQEDKRYQILGNIKQSDEMNHLEELLKNIP